jgi:hypothetical protein
MIYDKITKTVNSLTDSIRHFFTFETHFTTYKELIFSGLSAEVAEDIIDYLKRGILLDQPIDARFFDYLFTECKMDFDSETFERILVAFYKIELTHVINNMRNYNAKDLKDLKEFQDLLNSFFS